jgi:hypothetical protein
LKSKETLDKQGKTNEKSTNVKENVKTQNAAIDVRPARSRAVRKANDDNLNKK